MRKLLYMMMTAVILAACTQEVSVTEISVEPGELQFAVGESAELVLTASPEGTVPENAVWQSSDASVAAVNGDGTVTAISVGNAGVRVTCGTLSAICNVTVSDVEIESVNL